MKSLVFAGLQEIFDASLNNQAKFYRIYMTLCEAILLFIRTIREQSWEYLFLSRHLKMVSTLLSRRCSWSARAMTFLCFQSRLLSDVLNT